MFMSKGKRRFLTGTIPFPSFLEGLGHSKLYIWHLAGNTASSEIATRQIWRAWSWLQWHAWYRKLGQMPLRREEIHLVPFAQGTQAFRRDPHEVQEWVSLAGTHSVEWV